MALSPGSRLGSYEIVAPLGAGGMGEVYRARDTKLDRDVAVKVLPEHLVQDELALSRFEREAKAVAALSHPNILAIHDFGHADGVVYAVTELLEGETLGERLGQGPLPLRQATSIGRDIAEGLAAAHDQGIVHRDLKPDNVFLLNDGRVKILDFGLAKQTAPADTALSQTAALSRRAQTDPGTVLGTVGYMSPEQIRGEDADYRTDIFSFGVVLYEMLRGERPFRGDTSVETMTAILREDPPELTQAVPALPPALDSVVRRCLEKRREMRFQSARDLGFALVTSGRTSSVSSTALEAIPEPRRSRRWLVPVLGLAAGAVIGVFASPFRGSPPQTDIPRQRPLTFSGQDSDPDASPDGKLVAFVSTRNGTGRIWIKQIASGGEAPLTDGPDAKPDFSPDGSQVLFVRDEGQGTAIYRQGLVGGQPRKLIDNAYEAAWSPDGNRIAFLRSQSEMGGGCFLLITDGQGNGETVLWEWETFLGQGLTWSPDGSQLGVTGASVTGNLNTYRITDVDAGTFRELDLEGWPLANAAWSGSGDLIMAQATNQLGSISDPTAEIFALDPRTGSRRTLFWDRDLLAGVGGSVGTITILSPGTVVVDRNTIRAGLTRTRIAPGSDPEPLAWTRGLSIDRQPAFSPDGRSLVFSSNRSGQLDLWTLDTVTGETHQLTDDPALDWDPDFTPDGDHVLWSSSRSGHLEIWMAKRDGSGARQISSDGRDAENPTMTPDGEWVVYASSNPDKMGIWRVRPDGTDAAVVSPGAINLPEVSPDGRYTLAVRLNVEATTMRVEAHDIRRGEPVPFVVEIPFQILVNLVVLGRARWMPDGKAIAYVGPDEQGHTGIYAQDFIPGQDTRATRRPLAGFSSEYDAESFDIAPDGATIVVSRVQQMRSLSLVEGLTGVTPVRGQ